ncbi:hypothetical protein ACFWVF_18565 [Streptomyces sp. NPDC058659]|uniref:hypothetical protein n=1 Tax=unclassified Streptomyces TaxID=2593676 RepID=UPI0036543D62
MPSVRHAHGDWTLPARVKCSPSTVNNLPGLAARRAASRAWAAFLCAVCIDGREADALADVLRAAFDEFSQ